MTIYKIICNQLPLSTSVLIQTLSEIANINNLKFKLNGERVLRRDGFYEDFKQEITIERTMV